MLVTRHLPEPQLPASEDRHANPNRTYIVVTTGDPNIDTQAEN